MKIVHNKFITKKILFIFFLFMINCSNREKKDLFEFNPEMTTNLDLNKTDSIILEEYSNNKRVYSEWVKFEYKFNVDTAFTEFKLARYQFALKKKFIIGNSYRLIFNVKNKKYKYIFQNFGYDTLYVSNGMSYAIRSYILNGKKRYYSKSKYYLDY
ncbi:hypothetical protein SAMN05444387_4062 [Flavobacterium pectinovorum]|nr:hypothetical protein SAMN05444387_4062 [Flavobacterium pectinovorum]